MGTFLHGQRLYETMAVWETNAALAAQSDLMADFRDSLASSEQSRLLDERRFGNGVVHLRYRVEQIPWAT